jgi:hypothetical protein
MNETEFYENIPGWISKDKDGWNHITYLAYFCYKYEQKNGIKFRLVRGKKGPTMGKEAKDFAILFKLLAPEEYDSLKSSDKKAIRTEITYKIYNYINWMFDYKFRTDITSVNGTKLFHIPSLIVEFERMYAVSNKKNANRDKFSVFVDWCKENIPDIFDSHQLNDRNDLKMIEAYQKTYNLGYDSYESIAINKALEMEII